MEEAGLSCKVNPIATSAYPTKATRPAYSVLDKKMIKNDFHLTIRHWRAALRDCIKAMQQNKA